MKKEIEKKMRERKVKNIEEKGDEMIENGNIGWMKKIEKGREINIVNKVEMIDWEYGGKKKKEIEKEGDWENRRVIYDRIKKGIERIYWFVFCNV